MRRIEVRYFSLLLILVLAVLLPGPASAGSGLDERIDIELKDADVTQTLQSFGTILDAEKVVIDPAVSGEVTIMLHSVRVETVLTAICESLHFFWRFEDGVLTVEPEAGAAGAGSDASAMGDPLDAPIDLSLHGADLREVLSAFGRIAKLPVEIADEIEGEVTVEIRGTPSRDVLDQLCQAHHCRWEIVSGEAGTVLKVSPR